MVENYRRWVRVWRARLDRARVGEVWESTGPMGTFYYNPLFHGDDLVFLAGGSGVTTSPVRWSATSSVGPPLSVQVITALLEANASTVTRP